MEERERRRECWYGQSDNHPTRKGGFYGVLPITHVFIFFLALLPMPCVIKTFVLAALAAVAVGAPVKDGVVAPR